MKSTHFIGVDVAQHSLATAQADDPNIRQIANTVSAIRQWLRTLPAGCCIGVESTGDLHRRLVRLAIGAGHTVYVLNARDLAHYARALGRRAKTDRLDAVLIARYLQKEHEHLHPYRLPSELQAQLDELISRRHKVVVAQSSLRQSFGAAHCKPRELARAMRALQALIDALDERMHRLLAQDPQLCATAKHLHTMVGFGPLLSTAMAHALTRHPFQNSDAFIAYVGYDPRARDSGKLRGRRFLSKRGPAELRRLLFTAAMSASKTQLWRPFYERYRARGLPTTAVLVILARKLARIAFSMVKNATDFRPELVKSACSYP